MSQIKVLPESVINKIAAGGDRPSGICRERVN